MTWIWHILRSGTWSITLNIYICSYHCTVILSGHSSLHSVHTHICTDGHVTHMQCPNCNCMTYENIGCLDPNCIIWVMSSNHEQVCSYMDLVCMDVVFWLDLLSRSTWHTCLHIFGTSSICIVWLVSELFCIVLRPPRYSQTSIILMLLLYIHAKSCK